MLKSLAKPAPAAVSAAPTPDMAYLAARQFSPQWRDFLVTLAAELFGNFSADEARGFFRQIGLRMAAEVKLPVVETLEGLESVLNGRLSAMDWGLVKLSVEEDAIAIRHSAYPGQHLDEASAEIWRRAFSAVLEGVYTVWLQTQGGRADMEAKLRAESQADGFEFAYGL
ncbi:cellulose biosynthesis protein BcsD [Phenylobacterium immobile]|uniref:cellulose biosynthesis protein BcsD n=1 Tax=Phenylobacterium immobile TaxID=21 RepID=UPI000A656C8D|nr:cellulose biosynthesis protein BcsD [Phenylobacterium immobile]